MMSALNAELEDYSPEGDDPSESLHIPDELAGKRLDAAMAGLFSAYSRSRLQDWIREGLLTVDGRVVTDTRYKLKGGELVVLTPRLAQEAAYDPEPVDFPVVYEDEHILVVNKPVGLVVHPGNGHWRGTLLNGLLHYLPSLAQVPRAGIVHRLDKDTSGLMVVAKTIAAQTDLVRQLQARTVKRQYWALVWGSLQRRGLVDAPIGRHPTQRTKMAVVRFGGKEARTHYRPLEQLADATLVECVLDTGRTHQIRVHMTSIGYPLVGDATYGIRRKAAPLLDEFPRQALHARRLGLLHPVTGKPMRWSSPLPDDLQSLLTTLRGEQLGDAPDWDDEEWDDLGDEDGDTQCFYVRDDDEDGAWS